MHEATFPQARRAKLVDVIRAASLTLAAGLAACASGVETTGPLSASVLVRDVAALADPTFEGRAAGREGEREAAQYLDQRLRRAGLTPVRQAVPYGEGSSNLYVTIPGATDEVIVLGAHFDHLGRRRGALYPGADDNASGVALVLGVAEALKDAHLSRTVIVVLFGAEEHGLVGSRYFVAHPPVPLATIRAMINIDMIARPLLDQWLFRAPLRLVGIDRDNAVGLVGTRRYPGLRALADTAVAADGGGEIIAGEDLPPLIGREVDAQAAGRSDSASFEAAGIPALFFGDGESSDYHRPSDTLDKLDPDLLARRAHAIARVTIALAAAPASAFAASETPPAPRTPPGGLYVPIGFSTGLALHGGAGARTGALLGGEASLVYLNRPALGYAGLYADALHDGAVGATRLSGGPELGTHGFGVDGGYVVQLGPDGHAARHGGVLRVFASLAVVSITARVGYLAGATGADGGWFGELGLALKFPFGLRVTRM